MLSDKDILSVCSPREHVDGPYSIVFKGDNWAIVTLDYDNGHSLGIRWFDERNGNPSSHNYPTWFIIPRELYRTILSGLPIPIDELLKVEKYLRGEIKGTDFSIYK